MTEPASPLAQPHPWDLVSGAYAEEVVPLFEKFSFEALRLAEVREGQQIVDVATGPGTLAFAAAKLGARVAALDFSPEMIARLRERAQREGVTVIEPVVGDGMALPFDSDKFDAAFSMFGLFFFSDRAAGFRELLRVLRPGRRAVVGSWRPFDEMPLLRITFESMREALPGLPFGQNKAPLGLEEEMRSEMTDAGFRDVEVQCAQFDLQAPSIAEFWAGTARTMAPLVLMRKKLGEDAWAKFERDVVEQMRARVPDGPQRVPMIANLGVGVR
jgi:ubiquinone/menaquinone biosynthesis C-methylase UbiE